MKYRWLCLLLLLAFVGCDKYDDDNLDQYVEKGAKRIETEKAEGILLSGTGFWYGNGYKSFVIVDGQMVPYMDSTLMGYSFDKFEFDRDGSINVYSYSILQQKTCIKGGYIDWEDKRIYVGSPESTVYYKIRGVTDNYLILERHHGDVIMVCERMSDAQVTKYLSNTEFVDKRE